MLVSFLILNLVSYTCRYLFTNEILLPSYDVLNCNLAYGGRTIAPKIEKLDGDDVANAKVEAKGVINPNPVFNDLSPTEETIIKPGATNLGFEGEDTIKRTAL